MSDRALIALFALLKLALHLATSSGYGYFRDEFYYLACADHLALGYVDHPPLCVVLLAAVRAVLGDSRLAIRLLPALAGAATVALVGWMARRLGGGRWAMALAMIATLVAPQYLALGHFYSMNVFDILSWAAAAAIVILLVEEETTRRWCLLGIVLGLGLLNKISVLWLGAGLVVGILATPLRRSLLRPGPWLAGLIAAVLFAPYVVWEVKNGWPTREFIRNATSEKMVHVAPLEFLSGQVDTMLPFTVPLWVGGLVWLFAGREGRKWRVLAWTYVTVTVILMASGSSRAGYLAPAYTWLFAAGGVAAERVLARPRLGWLRPAYAGFLLLAGAAIVPLVLPVLPVETYIAYARRLGQAPETEERKELGALGQFYADMHGWDSIVATVKEAHAKLTPEEATSARVFAPDYGIAGAIDLLGRRQGLPPAISGHNNYWLWGPRGWDGRAIIVVGSNEERLRGQFEQVERAGTLDCGLCRPYENGRPVWIARRLRLPIEELWPRVKHYD